MNDTTCQEPARPFFLDAAPGRRFCLYHAPDASRECAGAILYVHPFGDEMNMSRHMAAMQARAFAAMGLGVLQIDLHGCGDSDGELRDASWEIWRQDLAVAARWLETHVAPAVSLWGLRLGATLAVDFARHAGSAIDTLILWQPVIAGKAFMTQFLRLRVAGDMLNEHRDSTGGTQALRTALASGDVVEVAGYELSPALVSGIDDMDLSCLSAMRAPIHWLEIVSGADGRMADWRMDTARAWMANDIALHMHAVTCEPFWTGQEIRECLPLLSATTDILAEATV